MLVLRARAQLRAARGTIFKFTAKPKNPNGNNNVELYNHLYLSQALRNRIALEISDVGYTTPRCYCRSSSFFV